MELNIFKNFVRYLSVTQISEHIFCSAFIPVQKEMAVVSGYIYFLIILSELLFFITI